MNRSVSRVCRESRRIFAIDKIKVKQKQQSVPARQYFDEEIVNSICHSLRTKEFDYVRPKPLNLHAEFVEKWSSHIV